MPFKYVIISPEDTSMKEGCIISEFNQCGLFLCQKGQAEILLGGRPYQINKRNLFIYTAANLLQIRQRIMIEVDLDYVIPIVNKVANSENLLYLRENPCLSLSEEQYTFVENLLKSVEKRINRENICNSSRQKQHLTSELIKSWGQVICRNYNQWCTETIKGAGCFKTYPCFIFFFCHQGEIREQCFAVDYTECHYRS